MKLSWKKSYSLALAVALGGRALYSSPCVHRWKRYLYRLFLLLFFLSEKTPALRVRDPNVGSTLLRATKTLSEKHLIINCDNLQLAASVRSFQSLQGTVWCSLCAITNQWVSNSFTSKINEIMPVDIFESVFLPVWLNLKCWNSVLFKSPL